MPLFSSGPPSGEPHGAASASAADVWLAAVTCWYLTGLIAALGFSLGFYLLQPGSPAGDDRRDWLDAFTWMDGRWYKQIATEGYQYDPDANTNVAFFPVYPLLGRALIRASGLRAEVALLIVSNLSLLAALAMLAFYVRDRYPDAPTELTDYALLAAALFPTGCFFRLTYSESTFLFLAILAMYAMLRRWPLWAIALVVGLATAARPVGVALLAPFAIHICRRCRARSADRVGWDERSESHHAAVERGRDGATERWRERTTSRVLRRFTPSLPPSFSLSLLRRLALYLPLATWGAGAFTVYQYHAFGEPFATVRVQKNWGVYFPVSSSEKVIPLATLKPIRSVYDATSRSFWALRDEHCVPWFSLQFANPIFFVTAVALISLGASLSLRKGLGEGSSGRWLSLEEVSLAALMLLIPYVTRAYEMGMGSLGRFVAVVFPVYLVLAHLLGRLSTASRTLLFVLLGVFLCVYTALYAGAYTVF